MRNRILALAAAVCLTIGLAVPASAQITVGIPGTPINVQIGRPRAPVVYPDGRVLYPDGHVEYPNGYYYDTYSDGYYHNGYYYQTYPSDYNPYLNGWHNNVYYRNGVAIKYRTWNGRVVYYRR